MAAVQATGAQAQAAQAPQMNPQTCEIQLNPPTVFNGDWLKFKHFHQAVLLYLSINNHIFHTDEQKIAFVLSYLAEKEATQWREAWVRRNTDATTNNITYPTWGVFITELVNDFNPIDEVGDVMHALQTLRQGSKSAEDISVDWSLLVSRAGIGNAGDTTLINLYQKILNRPLLKKILDSDNVPMTIQGWKDKAVQLDNNYRRKMAILGKTRENRGQTTNNTGRWFFRPNNQQIQNWMKDLNAMDVDALSIKQQEEAMKKGACFGCGEIGHISHNCPKKRQGGYGGWRGNGDSPAFLETVGQKAKIFSLTSAPSPQDYRLMSLKNSWKRLKNRVFEMENCLDVSVSFFIYFICTSSAGLQ